MKNSEAYATTLSDPFIFRLSNLTNELLPDVLLFDYDFEKQNKIKYSYENNDNNYQDFLRWLSVQNTTPFIYILRRIKVISNIQNEELLPETISPDLYIIKKHIIGDTISTPIGTIPFDTNTTMIELGVVFENKIQIMFSKLRPFETIEVLLFVSEMQTVEIANIAYKQQTLAQKNNTFCLYCKKKI